MTSARFVEVARGFIGVAQSETASVWWDEAGAWQGELSCTGLVLATMRARELLPSDFDINLSAFDGRAKTKELMRLLDEHARPISAPEPFQAGDLMVGRWRDVDPRAPLVHHLNILTQMLPTRAMLQVLSKSHGGSGRVCEVPFTPLDLARSEGFYRLKALENNP